MTFVAFKKDWERLQQLYPTVGASTALRSLIKAHVSRVDAKLARATETLVPELDIELETEEDEVLDCDS